MAMDAATPEVREAVRGGVVAIVSGIVNLGEMVFFCGGNRE
jgi:hypothetical protein